MNKSYEDTFRGLHGIMETEAKLVYEKSDVITSSKQFLEIFDDLLRCSKFKIKPEYLSYGMKRVARVFDCKAYKGNTVVRLFYSNLFFNKTCHICFENGIIFEIELQNSLMYTPPDYKNKIYIPFLTSYIDGGQRISINVVELSRKKSHNVFNRVHDVLMIDAL